MKTADTVLFFTNGDPEAAELATEDGKPLEAVILVVNEDGTVDVEVPDLAGDEFSFQAVPVMEDGDEVQVRQVYVMAKEVVEAA